MSAPDPRPEPGSEPGPEPGKDRRVLSAEEAERLWRRAAELQAEAARRLEEEAAGAGGGKEESAADPGVDEGYELTHVREAAVEAGIGDEFLRRALAEMDAGGVPEPRGNADAAADLFLGPGPRELVVTRRYREPVEEVYAALRSLVPSTTYPLRLRDARGPHPVEGGVVVFEVPSVDYTKPTGFVYELRGWADITEVRMTLERLGKGGTEVILRTPLLHSRRVNLGVGGGVAAVGGGGGGLGAGAALAAAISAAAGGLAPVVLVLLLTISAGVGMGLMGLAWRPLYRYALRRGEAALDGLLRDVELQLRAGTGALPGDGAPRLPPVPGRPGEG